MIFSLPKHSEIMDDFCKIGLKFSEIEGTNVKVQNIFGCESSDGGWCLSTIKKNIVFNCAFLNFHEATK